MAVVRVVVTTHTTRHLRRTLMGVAHQTLRPALVVVSCDNDDAAIRDLVQASSAEFDLLLAIVQRPFTGVCRSAQVRNNGVRTLLQLGASPTDHLVLLDGDCCPTSEAFAWHAALGAKGELVVGHRIELTPEQTNAFDETALCRGEWPAIPTSAQRGLLVSRHRRYWRHALLRKFGLVKSHKPKVLSANHSMRVSVFAQVNGYDEEYVGYGQEDDDFGRRVYASGVKPAVGVAKAIVLHQWHETRQSGAWHDHPGVIRFKQGGPTRAAFGLDRPFEQGEALVWMYQHGKALVERRVMEPGRH